MNGCWLGGTEAVPTAMQLAVLGHDTPVRPLLDAFTGFGLATTDQLAPSHCSTSVPVGVELAKALPTAVQLAAEGHDTLLRPYSMAPAGAGVVTIDQVVPSHCSTSALPETPKKLFPSPPTAVQLVALVHDTPVSQLDAAVRLELGLATTDQVVPFHCSTTVA